MTNGIAWALVSSFMLGVFFGALLAASIIIGVRLKITVSEARKTDDVVKRRYQFPHRLAAGGRSVSEE